VFIYEKYKPEDISNSLPQKALGQEWRGVCCHANIWYERGVSTDKHNSVSIQERYLLITARDCIFSKKEKNGQK